jgi:hypothetical protein
MNSITGAPWRNSISSSGYRSRLPTGAASDKQVHARQNLVGGRSLSFPCLVVGFARRHDPRRCAWWALGDPYHTPRPGAPNGLRPTSNRAMIPAPAAQGWRWKLARPRLPWLRRAFFEPRRSRAGFKGYPA